jgi:hypothetical protein
MWNKSTCVLWRGLFPSGRGNSIIDNSDW